MAFRWLTGGGKKEEKEELTLPLSDLPGWLDAREAELRARERETVSPFVQEFARALSEIRSVMQEFDRHTDREQIHPKLDKVTRDSLPLFEKSIQAHLSRKLPDDPWDYYQAAAECLKGCIKSLNGPGRYLTNLYPAEMKAVRTAVDRAGRAVNGMTQHLKETRASGQRIAEARTVARKIQDLCDEQSEAGNRAAAHQASVASLRDAISACDQLIGALEKGEGYRELAALQEKSAHQEKESETLAAAIRADLATVVHVLRKAQNVAAKDRREGVREIHRAVDLLEGSALPDSGSLGVIEAALPPTMAMIGAGEITLKNQEERGIFSDPTAFFARLRTNYSRYAAMKNSTDSLGREIRHHPVSQQRAALADERMRTVRQCREESRQGELAGQRLSHAASEIPALSKRLGTLVSEISGAGARIRLVIPTASGDA